MTGVQTCALPICFPVTISGGNAIGDLIAYNTGHERVVDKPKLTLFERIFGTKDENTKKQEEVIALIS